MGKQGIRAQLGHLGSGLYAGATMCAHVSAEWEACGIRKGPHRPDLNQSPWNRYVVMFTSHGLTKVLM